MDYAGDVAEDRKYDVYPELLADRVVQVIGTDTASYSAHDFGVSVSLAEHALTSASPT